MKTTLSLAALALAAALLALPTAPQAGRHELDGLHQDSAVHAIAMTEEEAKAPSAPRSTTPSATTAEEGRRRKKRKPAPSPDAASR